MDQSVRSKARVSFARLCGIAAAAGFALAAISPVVRADDKTVDFNKDIKPIFKESCVRCHSLENPKHKAAAGFRLDNREDALKGGDNGHEKDIIPGNAKDSVLYKLLFGSVNVDGEDVDAMPKKKKGQEWKALPQDQVALIKAWIDQGAKWGD